jgi:hypothetical protein
MGLRYIGAYLFACGKMVLLLVVLDDVVEVKEKFVEIF